MHFFEKILGLNLMDYGGANLPIGWILLCVFIGMIAATIIIQYTNAVVRRAVKALMRHKCIDAESAKTLQKLGLSSDRGVLRAIRRENPTLMRLLKAVEDEGEDAKAEAISEDASVAQGEIFAPSEEKKKAAVPKEPSIDIKTARFYLNPEMQDHAKEQLSRSDATVAHTAFYCGILVALYFAIALTLPYALSLFF